MDSKPLRVAVVDDEESVRKALQRLLRVSGMEVETFASGVEFLADVARRALDCAVIDLHMPAMGGFEIRERLSQQGIALPVVILTGHDKPEYRARASALGICAFLCKPVQTHTLLEAIRSASSTAPQVAAT